MALDYLENTQALMGELAESGNSPEESEYILQNLLELAVIMYRKKEIRTVAHRDKLELVCQLKKGSRRLLLSRK